MINRMKQTKVKKNAIQWDKTIQYTGFFQV